MLSGAQGKYWTHYPVAYGPIRPKLERGVRAPKKRSPAHSTVRSHETFNTVHRDAFKLEGVQ